MPAETETGRAPGPVSGERTQHRPAQGGEDERQCEPGLRTSRA
jgi:hypothetical protein